MIWKYICGTGGLVILFALTSFVMSAWGQNPDPDSGKTGGGGGAQIQAPNILELSAFFNADGKGKSTVFTIKTDGTCVNVGGTFNDQISSINTDGDCIRCWENAGCSGNSIRFQPGQKDGGKGCRHANLLTCTMTANKNWNDEISSCNSC